MKTIMVTGAAGFFGGILTENLLEEDRRVVSVDIVPHEAEHPNLVKHRVDLLDRGALNKIFASERIDGVVHAAAVLAHGSQDPRRLWASNVDGTRNVAEAMRKAGVRDLVFTSTNCLWGEGLRRPVREDDEPNPVEAYGKSKLEAEKVLAQFTDLKRVVIRCPTILDFGRLGLLSILFEFVDEGRRVWTVGGGKNRYQFIYAKDLVNACKLGLEHRESDTFGIGSDDVKSLSDVYKYVVKQSGSKSSVSALPLKPTIAAMKIAYHLKISPLGPYHYKMIAEDFLFDTTKIKSKLGWQPTLTNEQMLWRAYQYYSQNRREIEARTNVSAHRQAAKMGVIRLLKWVS